MALHELLASRRAELLQRWERAVRSRLDATPLRADLMDPMSLFVDELIGSLRQASASRSGTPVPADSSISLDHGAGRQTQGFDVSEVVREYAVLRVCVLDLAEEHALVPTIPELKVLSKLISTATEEAISAYVRQRDEEAQKQTARHLGFLAHELRNPLGSARIAIEILNRQHQLSGERAYQALDQSLTRLADRIDRTLVEMKLRAGAQPQRQPLPLQAILEEAALDSAADTESRQIRVAVEADPGRVVQADPHLLGSAVTNLVRNAVKFSKPGGTVTLRGRGDGARTIIEVQDSCGGIPADKLEKAFGEFVQLGADRSGFGLGLAIARHAVEAHGGLIRVKNLPGHGCIFTLEIP